MKKILNQIKSLWHGLFYGLKAADDTITLSQPESNNTIGIHKEVHDERVAHHLLKGEVTQAVEELRYRTFLVQRESEKYIFMGDGQVIKKKDFSKNLRHKKFYLPCGAVVKSFSDLQQNGDFNHEAYNLFIDYDTTPRFKLEKYVTGMDVVYDIDKNLYTTRMHISTFKDPYDVTSKPMILELEKFKTDNSQVKAHLLEHFDWNKNITKLFFITTPRVSEEESSNVKYTFEKSKISQIEFTPQECLITFEWDVMIREDLLDTFYSESMAQKYANHEAKGKEEEVAELKEQVECADCGKAISTHEGNITKYEVGRPLCTECYNNYLQN